jgi:transposase
MSRTSRKYTEEFKVESVSLALKSPSITKTADELGIPSATLYTWIYQLKNKSPSNIVKPKVDDGQDISALIEENRRLHKELAVTREEREILKKAAAYFAQHQK